MIPRLHRFHGHNSLNFAYRRGKTVRGEFVALRYVTSKKGDYRLAVVVSRKVSKSAVKRNRIRRRIYEIVRIEKMKTTEKWPYDLIISVFDERLGMQSSDKLHENIIGLLKKADIA